MLQCPAGLRSCHKVDQIPASCWRFYKVIRGPACLFRFQKVDIELRSFGMMFQSFTAFGFDWIHWDKPSPEEYVSARQ